MELPLEIRAADSVVYLRTTDDHSRTRLELDVRFLGRGAYAELRVADVQELAGALIAWLDDCGHELPDPPAGWVLLEQVLESDLETNER